MSTEPAPEILEFSFLVPRFFSLLVHNSGSDTLATMNAHGLTMAQMVTLSALQTYGPHSVFDISDRLNLSRAATSHLVDRLVQENLVDREENSDDRRQKRVTISPQGLELLASLDRSRSEALLGALKTLSPELQVAIAELMRRIMEEMYQAQASATPMRTEKADNGKAKS